MYNTSLRIVNNREEAEDVMQESFLTAFSKIGEYTGEGSFGGWLRRIVVNNSLDALKKRKEFVSIDDYIPPSRDAEHEDREATEYLVEEIRKGIIMLKDEDRVIFSLFMFEGYDHEEISSILQLSYNATRTRYSRAKSRLLAILARNRITSSYIHPN